MELFDSVTYILMFASVTIFLILWGLKKNTTRDTELFQTLCRKGQKRIYSALRKNGALTAEQLEKYVKGTKASLVYSTRRLEVKEPKAFVEATLQDMVEGKVLEKSINTQGETTYSIIK